MTHPLPTHLFDGRQLLRDPVELITYEVDAGWDRGRPDGICFPQSVQDLRRLVDWARQAKVPLVARGAGTGLAGGAVAELGGIVVVFSRMKQILDLDPVGRSARVEPGVVNLDVDAAAGRQGLYYPPDPSSGRSASIGGNLGTNAGGPHCFKYGVTTNYVTGLNAVLAEGRAVRLGGPALDYPEYDLCGLVVGSEGTLCLIADAYLRLICAPPGVKTMMVSFESEAQAGKAVSAVIAAGLVPATLELMDRRSMRMIEDFSHAGLPVEAGAALIVEVDGYLESLDVQMEEITDLLLQHGGTDFRVAATEAERQKIWYGRKSAAGAFSRLAPSYYLTDVTVRRSLLGDVLAEINAVCDRHAVLTANFFHAGDGNLHPLILCDPRDSELMERVHQAGKEIIQICLERDGSITGEHGVGLEKRAFMPLMYSAAELSAMQDIKEIFDPQGMLNPDKIFPPDLPTPQFPEPTMPPDDHFLPESSEEAARGLAGLSRNAVSVRIGSALHGDRQGAAIWLSTARLRGVRELVPEDLYIRLGAGTPVSEAQGIAENARMRLPLHQARPDATLGGLVAANLNAPLRMRYGALRDVMLCSEVVLADGRIIRAGRPLVKNVAGYDLPKLFVGSHGTLGLLTEITCKLIPLPRARRSLAVPLADLPSALRLARRALRHALVASAILILQESPLPGLRPASFTLLYSAEGIEEDVDAELRRVGSALGQAGAPVVVETSVDGQAVWADFLSSGSSEALLVRLAVPIGHLDEVLALLPSPPGGGSLMVDYAAGFAYLRAHPGNGPEAQHWLDGLRRAAESSAGYALVVSLPTHLAGHIDRWGYRPPALDVMRRLKERWDPACILNPGLFPVG